MKLNPEIINLDQERLETLTEQVQKSLPEEDAKIIIGMIETIKFICEKLEEKNVQIKRLVKRIFGIKSEKTKDIIKSNSDSEEDSENGSESACNNQDNSKSMAADESQKQEEEAQESEPQKGHGRNGIDKYLGANVISVVDFESDFLNF